MAQSRCRRGGDGRSPGADVAGAGPSPGADVAGSGPSPGADVAGAGPVPVQTWRTCSGERSAKAPSHEQERLSHGHLLSRELRCHTPRHRSV